MNGDPTFVGDDADSPAGVLSALKKAEDAFREWNLLARTIDDIYSIGDDADVNALLERTGWKDSTLDLFWSSFEVMKPAIYARPPQPVVAPLFKDNNRLHNTTAELLERCAVSVFKRTDIDAAMLQARDDVLFAGRGVLWLRYDTDDGKQVCVEHKDRLDFLHEPARCWSEVGWVAAAAWMTRREMLKRFAGVTEDDLGRVPFTISRERDGDERSRRAVEPKCKVWEVWHKADRKVYWVAENCDKFLDRDEPHLKLSTFWPCPKPAYATLRRRSLIPSPDYERYAIHFRKISDLTQRIYLLLDQVRMKGLIPAGGDVGDTVEQLMSSDDDHLLIPVPSAAMMQQGATGFVMWLPLTELAQAIQGLIEARTQLINDFYQLSGISDIMRGATDADETLGAQQLKSQYGSVRVREKSAELQRCAAEAVKIAAEIIADKFDADTLAAMAQMDLPTRAKLKARINDIEDSAEKELTALAKKAQEAASGLQGQQIDPAQAESAFQQAQQQVLAKYAPMLAEAEDQVPIEDVIDLLRDDRARTFTFEIESSSTILTDELQEKQSRNEFMTAFTAASQSLMGMAAMGEQGAQLAGELMKFVLAPYRAGRTLEGAIDAFIDAAPEMAAKAAAEGGDDQGLAEANKKLAEAEGVKAQAAMAGVQAKAALDQAENQRKFAELQVKSQNDQGKLDHENQKLRLQLADVQAKAEKTQAEIDNLTAQTAKILTQIGLDERKQRLSEYTAADNAQARQVDQAMSAQGAETAQQNVEADHSFRERGEQRADRQQDFTEQTAEADNGNG